MEKNNQSIITDAEPFHIYQRKATKKHCEEVYRFTMKDIVWRNVIIFTYLHMALFYSFYLLLTGRVGFISLAFAFAYGYLGGFGISAGAHRLWAHSSYKAKLPLRVILVVLNCISAQNCLYDWVRDHRVHHKYTDTDADPHNYSRGFFFAHIGWLMLKKHHDVKIKGKLVDMSDMDSDALVMCQKRYYLLLMPLFSILIPMLLMRSISGESLANCWHIAVIWRYTISLHVTWGLNSVGHSIGTKPFDKSIKPTDNRLMAILTHGDGWHNYHHTFPWDYRTGDLGNYDYNVSATFVELFAKIGWAYDLKTVSTKMIERRATRTGDGSIIKTNGLKSAEQIDVTNDGSMVWGWNDNQLPIEYKIDAFLTEHM